MGPTHEGGLQMRAGVIIWSLNGTEPTGGDFRKADFSLTEDRIEI